MLSTAKIATSIVLIYLAQYGEAFFYPVTDTDWNQYKSNYAKSYPSASAESSAKLNYAYNKNLIYSHNVQADLELRRYRLGINQFTDLKQYQIDALFPLTTQPAVSYATALPLVQPPPDVYNPIVQLGLRIVAQDQGTVCNAGWAYATAKAIEVFKAGQMGTVNPAPLSAQNLIDCAGQENACKRQVPQQAFDFLSVYSQDLHLASDYLNQPLRSGPGMCLRGGTQKTKLTKYSRIRDGDDATLKKLVAAGYPVVVEVNPTFEFMHYAGGLFDAPAFSWTRGSHFVTVIGYGHEAVTTNVPYWLVVNSFGPQWGENGFMRISRNAGNPLAKSAYLPTELGV